MKAKFTDVKTGETFEQSIQYASEIHALPKPNTPLCEWVEGRIITQQIEE